MSRRWRPRVTVRGSRLPGLPVPRPTTMGETMSPVATLEVARPAAVPTPRLLERLESRESRACILSAFHELADALAEWQQPPAEVRS